MAIFSTRHHEAIARVMADINRLNKPSHGKPIIDNTTMDTVINSLCNEFKADNPKFNGIKFMAKCVS